MKKLIIPVVLLMSMLLMGMDWVQETPTDGDGCAGYKPSNYEQPSRDHANIYSMPDSRDDSNWDSPGDWDRDHGRDSKEYYESDD